MTNLQRYKRYRTKGYPAHVALSLAKADFAISDWDWQNDETATREVDGFTLTLSVLPDEYPDISWLGYFTNDWEEGAIVSDRFDSRLCKWFVPQVTVREHFEGLKRYYSRSESWRLANEYARRDMETAREYYIYVIVIKAEREGIELGSSSIDGYDFDDERSAHVQAEQAVEDYGLVEEAISEAQETLAKLRKVKA